MARQEKIISLQDREQTLSFKIREMSAYQMESWVRDSATLLARAGIEGGLETLMQPPQGVQEEEAGAFLLGRALAALGRVDNEKLAPLLDAMLGCCSRMVEGVEERCTPQTVNAYIEDYRTLFKLRMEALKLNLGFPVPGGESASGCPA